MKTVGLMIAEGLGPHRGRMHEDGRFLGVFLVLSLLASTIVLAVMLFRATRRSGPAVVAPGTPIGPFDPTTHAEAILSERFARGEVPVDEFVTARRALRGEWVVAPPASPASPTNPVPPDA